ncbi:hypothetical protein [Neokomagataea thailandica]|uniref:hypothetical protein n=1 Tax=Neokomagataea TaxID=1223423 RepID=UPI00083783D5|nr:MULTISPECIES: hypothetical protein [Neokomagataea]
MNISDADISLYFMDWHGHLLSHDPMRDIFSLMPFTPGLLPHLTTKVPSPRSLPAEVRFIKHTSMPKPFPTCSMVDAEDGYVALFFPHRQRYLTCLPAPEQHEQAPIRAEFVQGWEKLIPFTATALRGLSLLMLPQRCAITSEHGSIIAPLTINPRSNIGLMDTHNIYTSKNINTFEDIGNLQLGDYKEISLNTLDGTDKKFYVKIL